MQGYLNGHPIQILVDLGFTYSFINSDMTKRMGLPAQETQIYTVQVANGDKIQGSGLRKGVTFKCQRCQRLIGLCTFRGLPICVGCSVDERN